MNDAIISDENMVRVSWADLHRGNEAGAASWFIMGIIMGTGAIAGFFIFTQGFLIQQFGVNPIQAVAMCLLLSIISVIILPLAGIVIGSIIGMLYATVYVKLPGKSFVLKAIVLSILFSPILAFIALLRTPPTEQPLLASLVTAIVWSLLLVIFGTLHAVFWNKLDAPGKETYFRRVVMRRLTYARTAYLVILLVILILMVAILAAPIVNQYLPRPLIVAETTLKAYS